MTNIQFNSGAIDATGCISQGWELIKKNYWMYFGITILAMIIGGCIPLVSLFLVGPIMVGVYYTLLRDMRGEPVDFGMMFKGFDKFVPAMVVGLIQAVPGIIFQIIQWTFDIGRLFMVRGSGGGRYRGGDPDLTGPMALFTGVYLIMALGFMVFSFIWSISFFFVMEIMAEHEIGPIDAIKLSARAAWSNFGGIFLLCLLLGLMMIASVFALCVGVFFFMPLMYAALAVAYRQVFPPLVPVFQNDAPPTPDMYGGNYGQGM
jgi:hypothetical protein